uniref:ATP synthase subunit s, mitochondrial isoform X2 n=1 Tax=Petromyzon marinus TaxID=7757 RepID=A0AAJ7X4D4_PETMA|nr:ATP synthase subunit s, mitochondrial isoform X2 [Petromyzon marinus]
MSRWAAGMNAIAQRLGWGLHAAGARLRHPLAPLPDRRHLWAWLNAVFNKVDHERILEAGPDRAASEWLLRCGAHVRYRDSDRWQQDYNGLPTGTRDRYRIEAINATDSCIMETGFDYLDGLQHVQQIHLERCVYIGDSTLERLSRTDSLVASLHDLRVVSCGNVSDLGVISLQGLRNLQTLLLRDLPAVKNKDSTLETLQKSLPACVITVDLP